MYQDIEVIIEQPIEASNSFAGKRIHLKERQIEVGQEYDPLKKSSVRIYYVRDFGAVGGEKFIEVGSRKYAQYELTALRNRRSSIRSLLDKFRHLYR